MEEQGGIITRDDREFRKLFREVYRNGEHRIRSRDFDDLTNFAEIMWCDVSDQGSRGRRAYSVSLTASNEGLKGLEGALGAFVRLLEGAEVGALFWREEAGDGRPHMHGIVVTRKSPDDLSTLWRQVAGDSRSKVKPITGSDGEWTRGNTAFARNLSRVVQYPSKQPRSGKRLKRRRRRDFRHSSELKRLSHAERRPPVRYATRGSGLLARYWALAMGDRVGVGGRLWTPATCSECGGPALPNRSYCRAACVTAAYRRTQAITTSPSVPNGDGAPQPSTAPSTVPVADERTRPHRKAEQTLLREPGASRDEAFRRTYNRVCRRQTPPVRIRSEDREEAYLFAEAVLLDLVVAEQANGRRLFEVELVGVPPRRKPAATSDTLGESCWLVRQSEASAPVLRGLVVSRRGTDSIARLGLLGLEVLVIRELTGSRDGWGRSNEELVLDVARTVKRAARDPGKVVGAPLRSRVLASGVLRTLWDPVARPLRDAGESPSQPRRGERMARYPLRMECPVCSSEIATPRANKIYCGDTCRTRAQRIRDEIAYHSAIRILGCDDVRRPRTSREVRRLVAVGRFLEGADELPDPLDVEPCDQDPVLEDLYMALSPERRAVFDERAAIISEGCGLPSEEAEQLAFRQLERDLVPAGLSACSYGWWWAAEWHEVGAS